MTPNFEFTELEVEAAQNLWGAFNDLYRACDEDHTEDDTGLVSLRNSMGTVHVRWLLRQKPILSAVVRAWDWARDIADQIIDGLEQAQVTGTQAKEVSAAEPEELEQKKSLTCWNCVDQATCEYAFDLYNTNGDCLARK